MPSLRLLVFAAMLLVCVSVAVPFALAQDPDDATPEPGYLDAPGDFGYPRSDDEVSGEQVDCGIDPGHSRCPIPPPYSISRPTASFTSTAANLSVVYQRVTWALQSSHYYKFELHRSKRASSGFTKSDDDWDEESPVAFDDVALGYYYKVRAKRCRIRMNESTCGAWGRFSSTLYVPEVATSLSFTLSERTLTTSYTAVGTSYDEIEVAERSIGSSGNGETARDDISGSGHREVGTEGNEYRFRVRRCTDRDRDDCGAWSGRSRWKPVPARASGLSPSLTDGTVAATYTASGVSTDDQIKVESRVGSSTTTGDPENIAGSGHSWGGLSGTAYRFQIRRCLDTGRKECGRWSVWSSWKSVPVTATNPSLTLSEGTLTATYTPSGASKDVVEVANRRTGSSSSGNPSPENAEGSGHRLSTSDGREYQFRVKRCSANSRGVRYDCGNWSGWSDWKPVPALASRLSLPLTDGTLSATYTASGDFDDQIRVASRTGRSTTTGDPVDITGSGHSWAGRSDTAYRFQIRRCLKSDSDDDSKECGNWSVWSAWKSVPVTATNPSLSLDYGELTASYRPTGRSKDVVEIANRSIGSSSSGSSSPENAEGSGHEWDGIGGREYSFRVKRCSADNRNVRYDCGHWSVWSSWQEVPASPTGLSQSRSGATLTMTYSGGTYNVIDLDSRRIGETEGSDYRTLNRDSGYSRTVDRGYDYQFRVSRCTSRSRAACGPWSLPTSWLRFPRLPDPPSDLVLKRSKDDLTLTYDRSSWSDGSGHYYEFELRQSDTERGTFDEEDTKDDTRSPLSFSNVDRGHWYQVFGRRCTDSRRNDCPDWPTTGSNKIEVPVLPGKPDKPSLTVSEDDLTVVYDPETGTYPKFNFASNDTMAGRYDPYSGGTLKGAKLSGVAVGKWYKVTLQLCTDDGLTDCSVSSDESDAAGVPHGKPGTPSLTVSDDDLTVVYTTIAGTHDQFDFESSPSSGGTYKDYTEGTLSGTKRSDVARGAWYKVRVRRCLDSQHTVCSAWSGFSSGVVVLPERPGKPTLTVSEDDLTVSYTVGDGFSSKDDYEFTSNDEESGDDYTAYTGGTLSGAKLEGVATGMWYKVRVRRCLEATHVNCSAWSVYSDAKEVPEPSRFPMLSLTIGSGADAASVVASFTLTSGYDYRLELLSRLKTSSSDGFSRLNHTSPVATETSHTFTSLMSASDYHYRAQLRACVSGSMTDCGNWQTTDVITVSKAPAPTVTGITVANEDDLTVAYTLPTWQHGSGTVYDFKIRRGESSSSTFTSDYTDATTPSGSPHKFNDVHTGYYYKALARRCSDSAKSICGDWSAVQSGVNVPALTVPPPTNIRVVAGQAKVIASFSNSSWAGQSQHHYVFNLGKSSSETGNYAFAASPATQTDREVSFSSVETGKWYKVRGKRCESSRAKRCGAWSESLNVEQSLVPDPEIEISRFGNSVTIGAGLSLSVIVTASGLDPTKDYSVVFTTSNRGAPAEILKMADCGSTAPNRIESSVRSRRNSSGPVLRRLRACAEGIDTLLVSVRLGETTVALDSIRVSVDPVPVPEDLRADGDNRGRFGNVKFDITWQTVPRATGYELRYAEECALLERLCEPEDSAWTLLPNGFRSRPAEVVTAQRALLPDGSNSKLYRVEVRAVRNGARSEWSEPVFVFPSRSAISITVAQIPFYGHQEDRDYEFRLCDNTFPSGEVGANHARWVDDIIDGFASWGESVNWLDRLHYEPRTFVTTTRDTSMSVGGRDACEPLTLTRIHLDLGFATIDNGISDYPEPEVRFVNRAVLIDRCFAFDESVVACAPHGNRVRTLPTFVSNPSRTIADNVDILFDGGNDWYPEDWWDDKNKIERDKGCSHLFRTAAHEVGHALGVWSFHSSASDSIMRRELSNVHCEPQHYDVVGMLTNYQWLR